MGNITATVIQKLKANGQYETYETTYSALRTDEDRVKVALRLLRKEKLLFLLPGSSTKSMTISENYREQGNNSFVTPHLDTTIELYTKSIVFAPPGSRELALGYANRSAALFKARLYQDCLQDISRALALPYPDDLKAKLYARQARCLMVLKSPTKEQEEKLREALKMAAEYLDKMAADSKGRSLVEKTLKEPAKMVPLEGEYIKWRGEDFLPEISEESPELKGVSSALKLEFNEEFGRHVVATRDINPGEILAVIKPYVSVVVRENLFTHCSYCTQQTWSSVPCEGCCNVVYCNEDCKNQAYNEYHDVECQVTRHLFDLDTTALTRFNVRLTVKAIKESGSIQVLREKVKEIEDWKDPRTIGFTQGFLDDKDYAGIYTLVRNTEKLSFIDILGKSLESSYILLALATKSNIFGKKFENKLDDLDGDKDVTFVGGLILRHLQILCCNGHSLYEGRPDADLCSTAAVLMPFSQMNHSCNPTVTKTIYGTTMAFSADYVIKKGEQIFDSYGEHFATSSRFDRQMKLQEKYQFFCNCVACTEDWPLSEDIPSALQQCLLLHTEHKYRYVMRNFLQYWKLACNMEFTDPASIIADLNNMAKFLCENFELPCVELTEVRETKNMILICTGRRFQSVNLSN